MRIRVIAVMTDAKFGDTVPAKAIAEDGPCHAAIARCRHRFPGFADCIGRCAGCPQRSECLAMANAPPRAMPVSHRRVAAKADDVAITYAGHSTYYIDTPGGVRIATDFNGAYRHRPAARYRHHEPGAQHALHAVPRSENPARPSWLGRERASPRMSTLASATSTSAMSPPTSAATRAKVPTAR